MIRIGILGYGNLGRGVEKAINHNSDMELVAIFTRRNPEDLGHDKAVSISEISSWKDDIDVWILCGGSATDLPIQTPEYAKLFNVVDSFDTHANIPQHFDNVDKSAKDNNKTAVVSVGWDPGMFSINRLYANAILPNGNDYTFWGKGISQGHSDAIRRIDGVKDARQYTIPLESALNSVKNFENPVLATKDKHKRECFVVLKDGANADRIENEIKSMPNYFADYETIVHFVSQEELDNKHKGLPHGGLVIRTGTTSSEHKNVIEYSLKLDSNPEFTASVLVAYARAAYRLSNENNFGCKTVFDIAPAYLINKSSVEIVKTML